MKKQTMMLFATLMMLIMSCSLEVGEPSSDQVMQKQTEQALQEATREIGMPAIVNFQEKKLMKMIYELRDQEDVVCYAYFFNKETGSIGQFLGKCIGYGIPYSTQFSNPEKKVHGTSSAGYGAGFTAQAEPNGLFMPEGLSATWLLLLDENNEPRPTYVEPEIIVSPFPLH